jgi:hypothetical protein
VAGRAGTARKLAANGYQVEARRERMVAQLEVEVVEGMAAARGSGSRRAESESGRRGVAGRGVEPRAAAGAVPSRAAGRAARAPRQTARDSAPSQQPVNLNLLEYAAQSAASRSASY